MEKELSVITKHFLVLVVWCCSYAVVTSRHEARLEGRLENTLPSHDPLYCILQVVEIDEPAEGGDAAPAPTRVLGTLAFEDLPAGNGDGAIEIIVGFTLRSEGFLKVEALERGTKTARELVIGHE